LRWARRYSAGLYDFQGLRAFKGKFRPAQWSPIYLSHPAQLSAAAALYHSLSAFARHGLWSYGLHALLRGPEVVLRGLSLLLVPWALLLACLDAAWWFPAPWVKWSWVGFDLLLALAIFVASRRFRPWLSRALLLAVLLDTLLTAAQALLFNLPKLESVGGALGVLVGVLAPALALVVLLSAHGRLSALAYCREKGVKFVPTS
jgi:phosphatidylglycerol lysyltransferase